MVATIVVKLKKCDSFTLWVLLIPTGSTNVSHSVHLLLWLNLIVFLTIFFSHISIFLFPFVFYIPISLRCLALLFIYLSRIHSDEGLQSEMSVFHNILFTTVYNLWIYKTNTVYIKLIKVIQCVRRYVAEKRVAVNSVLIMYMHNGVAVSFCWKSLVFCFWNKSRFIPDLGCPMLSNKMSPSLATFGQCCILILF